MRIAIDLMGSENSPAILFEAVLQAASQLSPSDALIAIATEGIAAALAEKLFFHAHEGKALIELLIASDSIEASDDPLIAARRKPESSMLAGIHLLKKRQIDAFISAGNTGALIASATLNLPLLPTIKRPALLVSLPTLKKPITVVDVGGNVFCKTHQLVQFAQMGAAHQACSRDIEMPTVGLLNIGIESKKGTATLRQTYQALQALDNKRFHFIGNIEPSEVFQGDVDVIVTDGFTGNILLKTSEGISSFMLTYVHNKFYQATSTPSHLAELHLTMDQLQGHFSYSEYPGAVVCGIDGIVIKCHGRSSPRGIFSSIMGAANLIENGLINKMKSYLLVV